MLMAGVRISWEIPHAKERARERGVSTFEAERVIKGGTVEKIETGPFGETRWLIAGWDADSRPIHIVVRPVGSDVLRVITVIRKDE